MTVLDLTKKGALLREVLKLHFMECGYYLSDEAPDQGLAESFVQRHLDDFEDLVVDFVGQRWCAEKG